MTLTGTAVAGSTVTVWDGGASPLGTTTASSAGAWSFTTVALSGGAYPFTANDSTASGGTSAACSAYNVTMPNSTVAAPVISTGVANAGGTVTLTGTAVAGSTVTVCDGGASPLGTTTASSAGAWSFTTVALSGGAYPFTATDSTVSGGTSDVCSAYNVTVPNASLVNGNFPTGDLSGWTLGGNFAQPNLPEIYVTANGQGGSTYAAGMGSMGSDGTLSQTVATTAGQTYTLSFWLENEGSTDNDFNATWNGQTLLSLANAAQSGYKQYTYSVTAAGPSSTLVFSAMNGPSQWDLDNVSLTAKVSSPVAAPVITQGVVNSNGSVTLTGTAVANATVTVCDGAASPLGTATASSTGAWSYTTPGLTHGAYPFTATDTTSAGTSAASSALNLTVPLPAAPVISKAAVNANESVTLTGTAAAGAVVTVSDGAASPLGTATASSAGAWTFTSVALSGGAYPFTATDTTAAGTSAASSAYNVTVPSAQTVAAPVITKGVVNANGSVTLTGTAVNGAKVTVCDGAASPLGSVTASSSGAWSYTTPGLTHGAYPFTATETTSAGTSAASSALNLTVPLPAAPVISKAAVNANESVTLTGTAVAGAKVTVSDGAASPLGTATASSAGAWTFTTIALSGGAYPFTATDTTAAGTSAASSAYNVTVPNASLTNGNFQTGNLTGWTLGGNFAQPNLPEIYVTANGQGGSTYAAGMGSMGSDGTLSQTVATTAGQTYTLSFWLENEGSTGNDFKATWNGQTLLSLANAGQSGYKQYTYSVTAAGPSSTLVFSAMNTPSQWDLDNVSLTAKASTSSASAPNTTAGALANVISLAGSSSGTALVNSNNTSTAPTLLSASSLPHAA